MQAVKERLEKLEVGLRRSRGINMARLQSRAREKRPLPRLNRSRGHLRRAFWRERTAAQAIAPRSRVEGWPVGREPLRPSRESHSTVASRALVR